MKKLILLLAKLLVAVILFGQANIIDTSFYSNALQETKLVDVYLPPGYDENPDWNYPVIYYLHGWGGNQNIGSNSVMDIADNLIIQDLIEPVIIVSADNSPGPFGGSWYMNSILWGDYEDFMMTDLVTWIDDTYRTIPEKDGRALMGQSMGCVGSFRYGILYKEMFQAITGHAGPMIYDVDLWLEIGRQVVLSENQPGPPFTYTYSTGGPFTKGCFLMSGAFCPNLNSPQPYIDPQNVEYIFDENGEFIDTVLTKWQANDMSLLVKQLNPEDSVGIYYGCGTSDDWLLYPALSAFADTLEMLGLPFEFYSHSGNHTMPYAFKVGALNFIDSLVMAPGIYTTSCLSEGITFYTQDEIDNFQINHPYCTEIEGDVAFGSDDITNLNGLASLNSIGGSLYIGYGTMGGNACTNLTSLAGLENLNSIGSNLHIYCSSLLEDISAISNLTSIGGDLYIFDTSLESLNGLDNIEPNSIENINIWSNPMLSVCNVESICDYLITPNGTIYINDNATGCNSVQEVEEACLETIVEDVPSKVEISISPNPVSNFAVLSLYSSTTEVVEIFIYNITGTLLMKQQFSDTKEEMVLSMFNYPAGIYLCRILFGDEIVTKKIIKQ